MLNKNPLFTIAIPAYNAAPYLEDCFNSVIAQSFNDYEVVIVDDGSTDETSVICDKAASSYGWRVKHKDNEGLLVARSDAIDLARGDYIVWLDSDDQLDERALSLIADIAVTRNPDFIAFDYFRDLDDRVGVKKHGLKPGFYEKESLNDIYKACCTGEFNNMCTKVFKRTILLLNNEIYRSSYPGLMHGEDWIRLLGAVEHVSSAFYIDLPLYYYRPDNLASSSNNYRPTQISDLSVVIDSLFEYAPRWGGDCPSIALRAGIIHVCYLAKLLVTSGLETAQKKAELGRMSSLLKELPGVATYKGVGLRLDMYLLWLSIRDNSLFLVSSITKVVGSVKNVLAKGNAGR